MLTVFLFTVNSVGIRQSIGLCSSQCSVHSIRYVLDISRDKHEITMKFMQNIWAQISLYINLANTVFALDLQNVDAEITKLQGGGKQPALLLREAIQTRKQLKYGHCTNQLNTKPLYIGQLRNSFVHKSQSFAIGCFHYLKIVVQQCDH